MTTVKASATKARISVTEQNSHVTITEQPVHVKVTPQSNVVTIQKNTSKVIVQAPTAPTLTIQKPESPVLVLRTSGPSMPTILDAVRTDAGFPVVTKDEEGRPIRVTRDGKDVVITYNDDGTMDTQTITTATQTVARRAVYNSDGFLKFIPI